MSGGAALCIFTLKQAFAEGRPLSVNLTGKLLIAMPGMSDPRFGHAVIFMADHSDKGAMGLIVNKPAEDLRLSDVLDQLDSEIIPQPGTLGVHIGGPVETGRGFVLHSDEYTSAMQTMKVSPGFAVTATLDILEDLAAGNGPRRAQLMLGYAGWGPQQLEGEIARNGWLTVDASEDLVFELPDAKKWSAALHSIGIDPLGLSAAAGRA